MNQKLIILLVTVFLNGAYSSPANEQKKPSDTVLPEEKLSSNSSVSTNHSKNISEPILRPTLTNHLAPVKNISNMTTHEVHETENITKITTVNPPVDIQTISTQNATTSVSTFADEKPSSVGPLQFNLTPTVPPTISEKTVPTKPTHITPVSDSPTTNRVVAKFVEGSHFDGPSFIGGIVLTIGLTAIGFIAFKYYKSGRIDMNYRTL